MSPKSIQIPKCLQNVTKFSAKTIQNQNVSKKYPTFFQKLSKKCPKSKMYLKCLQTHLQKVCKKCPNPNGPVVSSPEGLMQHIIQDLATYQIVCRQDLGYSHVLPSLKGQMQHITQLGYSLEGPKQYVRLFSGRGQFLLQKALSNMPDSSQIGASFFSGRP